MMHRTALAILAALVFAAAGCGAFEVTEDHDGDHAATDGDDGDHDHPDTPPIDGAPTQSVTGDAMAFVPSQLTLSAGEPTNLELTSEDVLHDLTIDEVEFHVAADAGRTLGGGVVFDDPGTYVAYCSVPGHREAGMELEITVE